MSRRFRSLRVRLLLPLVAVALLASVAVAVGSYVLGDRWAREQATVRFRGIASTISAATFPLTQPVVVSIAQLTDTEIMTVNEHGRVMQSSLTRPQEPRFNASLDGSIDHLVTIDDRRYRYGVFQRQSIGPRQANKVIVLFDESGLASARWRAAGLPLVTGLSTIILLTSVTLLFASRLIRRLSRLQQQVDRVAQGDFHTDVAIGVNDEVGMLGSAVTAMSRQLDQMWATLQRQQGEKLLHQVAGGLAHQLRNSITGARMAMELHAQKCNRENQEISVAVSQLEQTEEHVRRLLAVASGSQEKDQPATVGQCVDDVRATLDATAKHLGIRLQWQVDESARIAVVGDGPSLNAALSNLILNAIQASRDVSVQVATDRENSIKVDVLDDGDGPPPEVADEIFEPFVTSKPEGLGLGLPLVARSAKRLGGGVAWRREGDQTRFTLSLPVTASD